MKRLSLLALIVVAMCDQVLAQRTCQCPSQISVKAFGEKMEAVLIECEEGEISRISEYSYSTPSYAYAYVVRATMEDSSVLRIELELWDDASCSSQEYGYQYSQAQFEGMGSWWFHSTWLPTNNDGGPKKRITYPGYTGWVEGMKDYKLKLTVEW